MKRVSAIPKDKINSFLAKTVSVDDRLYVLSLIAVTTGLRISDILRLSASVVRTKNFLVHEAKTGKDRVIELDKSVKFVIRQYVQIHGLSADDFLIYSNRSALNKPMSRAWAYRLTKEAASRCGLKNVSPHSFRKTFAKEFYKRVGGNIEATKSKLNHDYISTTLLYLIDDFSALDLS